MSFMVKTARETGTITYHCATPHIALEKVQAFRRAEYQDITVCNSDDLIVTESLLQLLVINDDRYRPETRNARSNAVIQATLN